MKKIANVIRVLELVLMKNDCILITATTRVFVCLLKMMSYHSAPEAYNDVQIIL